MAIIAGLLYLAYNYAIVSFSVAMNPLTALHITIVGLAGAISVTTLGEIAP